MATLNPAQFEGGFPDDMPERHTIRHFEPQHPKGHAACLDCDWETPDGMGIKDRLAAAGHHQYNFDHPVPEDREREKTWLGAMSNFPAPNPKK